MPISLSAKKSLRKSLKNHKENAVFKNSLKKTVKKFLAKPSADSLKEVYSALDKAVKKNVFHKNKTARLKSEYAKRLSGKSVAKTAVKAKKIKKGSRKVAKSKVKSKKV
jgi:small subunit ribosomal protein S20